MSLINAKKLNVGMIVAEDTYSPSGQLIIRKDSILTRQMISHLKYFSINEVNVSEDELADNIKNALNTQNKLESSHLEMLLNSKEFKEFRKDYVNHVDNVSIAFNDIVTKNTAIDGDKLIQETFPLFEKEYSFYSLFGMLHAINEIDDSTYTHSINVAMIARLIGTWQGMSKDDLNILTLAGLFHDIGKCQIPSEILLSPRKLTKQEFEFVKMHAQFGYNILKNQNLDPRIKNAALHHHERCDGSGYPYGKKLEDLDDFTCIVSIADVYDALTANRCYRSAICPFEVISIFEEDDLRIYHPKYIQSFLEKIASSFLNSEVLLNTNDIARIIYINKRLTRPIVQLNDGTFVNLEEHPDIYIQAIV